MGTCCAAHLPAMIYDNAPNAQNGAVTVKIFENPLKMTQLGIRGINQIISEWPKCDMCISAAEFEVSIHKK